jgi:sugar phosphate isomerase/epimerase
MCPLSRREFLGAATTSAAAIGFLGANPLELSADPLGLPIGCQTWPVWASIAKDFPGTIKQLADAGFQSIELCSPYGYEEFGFGGLAKYSAAEFREILSDAGVACISSHFGIAELRKNQERSIEWAKDIGLTQMLVPSLDGPKNPTLDDVKRAADEYNKMAERAAKAGIQQGLHNEEFELSTVNGKTNLRCFVRASGSETRQIPVPGINHWPGLRRRGMFHQVSRPLHFHDVQGWSAETKKIVSVGLGTLDWKKIFTAAKIGGIKNYFVEMNLEKMRASVPYLHQPQIG